MRSTRAAESAYTRSSFRQNLPNLLTQRQNEHKTTPNSFAEPKQSSGSMFGPVMAVEKSQPSQGSFIGSFNRKKKMPVDTKSSENAVVVDEGGPSIPETDANNTRGAAPDIPEIDEVSDPIDQNVEVDDDVDLNDAPPELDADGNQYELMKDKLIGEKEPNKSHSLINFDETPIIGGVTNSP